MSTKVMILMPVFALTALMTVPAEARSPHFIAVTATGTSANTITVSGKAAGLAGGNMYDVDASGSVDANVDCINPGNHNVEAQATTIANVSGSGTFTADRNGNFNFNIPATLSLPSNPCPNSNWAPRITSYDGDITVSMTDAGQTSILDSVGPIAVSFP